MNPLPIDTLRVLLVVPILVMAGACLTIGLAVIIRNSPLVVPASLPAGLLSISAGSLLVASLVFLFTAAEPALCILTVFPSLLFYVAWRSARGYIVIAVTEGGLRSSLQSSLADLGLTFEESILGFALPSLRNSLQVRSHPPLGMAQLRMELPGHSRELASIAQRVRHHVRIHGQPHLTAAIFFGLAGLALLVLAVYQTQRF